MQVERNSVPPYEMIRSDGAEHGHHVYMFLDDIRLHLVPLSGYSLNDRRFEVHPADGRIMKTIASLFSETSRNVSRVRQLTQGELSDVLAVFIEAVGRELALRGVSYWEIGRVLDGEAEPITCYKLLRVAGEVSELRNQLRQRCVLKGEGKSSQSEILVPSSRVQVFRLPSALGSEREQRRKIGILREASVVLPPFVEDGLTRLERVPNFQQSIYSEAQFRAIARAMKKWGWMGRFWQDKYTTEYYWYWCKIRFLLALALLRESILGEIDALLKRLEIDCVIRSNGLKTADEINEVLEHLKSGSISFGDALEISRA